MPISHVLENFRRATTNLHASGDKALWDGLDCAADQIQAYASSIPMQRSALYASQTVWTPS